MYIISIIGLIAVIFFGYLIVNIFLEDENFLEKIALGYIIGFGFYTFVIFMVSFCGVKFRLFESSSVLAILIIILILINKLLNRKILVFINPRKIFLKFKKYLFSLFLLGKTSFIFIFIITLSLFVYNYYWPLRGYDAFVLYDFNAKSFIATSTMDDAILRGSFFAYPLMTSFSHMWLYLIGFTSPMFFYTLFYISFIMIFYFSLRKIMSGNLSIIFTAIFVAFPDFYSQAQVAYTNLPNVAYLVLGGIYLYLGIKSRKTGLIIISMLLTILSGWTRSIEPFWIVTIITVLIYGIFSFKNFFLALAYSIVVYIFRLPWNRFFEMNTGGTYSPQNQIFGGSETLIVGISNHLNIKIVSEYFYTYAIRPYLILYICFFVLFLFNIYRKSKDWWYFIIVLGNFSLLLLGTYVFSLSFSEWRDIPGSFRRVVILLIPMMIYFIAISSKELWESISVGTNKITKK